MRLLSLAPLLLLCACPSPPTSSTPDAPPPTATPAGGEMAAPPAGEPPPAGQAPPGGDPSAVPPDGAQPPAGGQGAGTANIPSFGVDSGVKLSGTVTGGSGDGQYRLDIFTLTSGNTPLVVHVVPLEGPGAWEAIAPKNYGEVYILAYLDRDKRGPDNDDPYALMEKVEIGSADIANLNMKLKSDDKNPFSKENRPPPDATPAAQPLPADGTPPAGGAAPPPAGDAPPNDGAPPGAPPPQ